MAKFTYTGDIALVFVDATDLATGSTLLAVPGEVYELDANPDDSLFSAVKAPKLNDAAPAVESK